MGDADLLHGRAITAIGDMRNEIELLRAEVELRLGELDDAWKREAVLKHRAETAERELAALRDRIEKAPEGFVNYGLVYDDGTWFTYAPVELEGKRVRLVRED